MENSESSPSVTPQTVTSLMKENVAPISPKIEELTQSRQELLSRVQNLKQDLQNWRLNMDTQVKVYRAELSELKKTLNTEVEQLRSDFHELRTTLQQQQEDVSANLRNLGLQDDQGQPIKAEDPMDSEHNKGTAQDLPREENGKDT